MKKPYEKPPMSLFRKNPVEGNGSQIDLSEAQEIIENKMNAIKVEAKLLGAEILLGRGDMLIKKNGEPQRAACAMIFWEDAVNAIEYVIEHNQKPEETANGKEADEVAPLADRQGRFLRGMGKALRGRFRMGKTVPDDRR